MQPYQIIILILLLLVFVYVGAFLLILSNSIAFLRKLNKRKAASMVFLIEKQEVLLAWFDLFEKAGGRLSPKDETLKTKIAAIDSKIASQSQWNEYISLLKNAQMRLNSLSNEISFGSSEKEKGAYVSTLGDLDANYRQSSAIYNADVVGFNYWISIPGFSWLLFLFGFRKRNSLN